jgi:hypothetical protein
MIVQTFYAGLNFSSRNLLDLAAGGTFMSLTLGAATKLLDNMMVNYSEWHTERAITAQKNPLFRVDCSFISVHHHALSPCMLFSI